MFKRNKKDIVIKSWDKPSRFKRIFSFIAKSMLSIAMLLILLVVIISYSPSIRHYLLNKITNVVNEYLIADIEIDDIHILNFNGIALQHIRVMTAGDTLAYIPEIEANINFESLFSGVIDLNYVKLNSPNIKLLRNSKDSLWNYTQIVKPSQEPKEPSSPSSLKIKVGELVLNNAKFAMWDSTVNYDFYGHINYQKMALSELNLHARNILVDMDENLIKANILNLSAYENPSKFRIDKFAGNVTIDKNSIELENTELALDNAHFNFDAKMDNFSILTEGNTDIEKVDMYLDLQGHDIDLVFIDNFAILPIRLGFVKDIDVKAKGTLMDLDVSKLILNTNYSHIDLSKCRLTNLLEPDSLSYQGILNSTSLSRQELPTMLKNIDLAAVPDFGKAFINNTKFYGTLDTVYADVDIKSTIGNVKGDAGIGFGKNPFSYDIDLSVNRVNLANILKNNKLSSNIDAVFNVKGKGLTSNNIFAQAKIDLKRSNIFGLDLKESNIVFDAIGDSVIIHNFSLVQLNKTKGNNIVLGDANGNILNDDIENNGIEDYLSKVSINGGIGLKTADNPHLVLNIDLENIELLNIVNKFSDSQYTSLPTSIDSKINLDINDFNIDNILGNFFIDISRLEFNDKSMLPLTIRGMMNMQDTSNQKIELDVDNIFTDILYLSIDGKYKFTELLNDLSNHFDADYKFISKKLDNSVFNKFTTVDTTSVIVDNTKIDKKTKKNNKNIQDNNIINKLNHNEAVLNLQIRDLDWINILLPDFNSSSSYIDANLRFNSNYLYSSFDIDSIQINNLELTYNDLDVNIGNVFIEGSNNINIIDTISNIDTLYFNIRDGFKVNIANISLDSINFYTNINQKEVDINLSGSYNNILQTKINGIIDFSNKNMFNMNFDTLMLLFNKQEWHNIDPINIAFSNDGIDIYNFGLERDKKENLFIKGNLHGDTLNNVSLRLNNFEFNDLQYILNDVDDSKSKIFAKLDTLKLDVTGTLNDPIMNLSLFIDNIQYAKQNLGYFNAYFRYNDSNFHGHARMFNPLDQELLSVIAESIPIYIGLDKEREMFVKNKNMALSVLLTRLPAQILSPFIPMVDNLKGMINGKFNINGNLPDNFSYDGNVNLENLHLRLIPTNIVYSAFGDIKIETDKISFSKLKLRNSNDDLKNGEAVLDGTIKLDHFNLKYLDFSLNTNQFLLLNDQTESSMPWLFGKLVIATENNPIRFYGTLNEPNLTGSLVILNSELKMPQLLSGGVVKRETKFNYINKDTLRMVVVSYTQPIDSIDEEDNVVSEESKDFMDNLNIDMSAKIRRLSVLLDLGSLGQIFARVGAENPSEPIRYIKTRDKSEAQILGGSLEVLEGSNVQIMRSMAATGTISFPTAKLSQPNLNLIAEYQGKMLNSSNSYDNFSVFANITGTTTNPKLELSYSINGVEATGDKKQIEENAFVLLTTGKLSGYSDASESRNLVNEGASMVASQLASRTLTDLLIKTGVVQSANLQFEGEDMNTATVKISGTLGGFANWTIGGNIADITSNYNISIDIPIVIKANGVNNLMLQLSKFTDLNTAVFDKDSKLWEVKLKVDGSW